MFPTQGSKEEHSRAGEFKTGLGDINQVSKRHAEKAGLRSKKKRDEKISRIRKQNNDATFVVPDNFSEQALLARNVFLKTASLEALQFIQKFLKTSKKREVNALLDDQGMLASAMVTLLKHNSTAYVLIAADCLVNITGNVKNDKLSSVAMVLTKTDFISIAYTHVTNQQSPIRLDMWMCIANMACLCQDARNYLLETPLFKSNNNPPFTAELAQQDPATLPVVLLTLQTFYPQKDTQKEDDTYVLNEPFTMAQWRTLCNILYTNCPAPMKQTDRDRDLSMVLLIMWSVFDRATPLFRIRLISIERSLIVFLVGLLPRICDIDDKIRVAKMLVAIGILNVPQCEFQNIMREAGCIQLMTDLSQSGHEDLKREAIVWIANYAAESYTFVRHLLQCRAFDGVAAYLQHPSDIKYMNQAIYVLKTASQSCYTNRTAESDEVLRMLLGQNGWLRFTCERIGRIGCVELTLEILSFWIALVKWDIHFVRPILEELGGLKKLDVLLADKNPAIWSLSNRLDEMLNKEMEMDDNN
jgi:hypothetical protein